MATHATAADLGDEQLRAAWRRIHRASWPDTFEEAMVDATLSRLVVINAKHPPPVVVPAVRVSVFDPPPLHVRQPRALPGYVDVKRLAAGDRDD